MWDAFLIAFRVGLEGAIAGALGFAALRASAMRRAAAPFAVSVATGLSIGLGVAFVLHARGLAPRDLAPALHRTEHLYALALAGLALLARGRSADDLAAGRARGIAETAALSVGLLVLLPEGAFLAPRLGDLAVLRGAMPAVAASAAAGVAAAAAAPSRSRKIMLT